MASEYDKVLAQSRQRLTRFTEGRGVSRLKKLYDEAQATLERKLATTARKGGRTFTAHTQRIVLAQIKDGQAQIAAKMAGELGDFTEEVQVESLRGLAKDVKRLERYYVGAEISLPIDEAARFAGVVDKRRSSLLKMHEESMANYGGRLIGKMEDRLAQATLMQEPVHETVSSIAEIADVESWQAERIIRTESSFASNATVADGVQDIAEEVDGAWLRWEEHVSDDGEPLDDRTSKDSLSLHGQCVKPGGLFMLLPETLDGEEVDSDLVGQTWAFPPNRPNDRASVTMWMPSWGGLAWKVVGDDREYLSR